MYVRPIVYGINARKPPAANTPIEQLMMAYGRNTGNMLFSEALLRSLKDARMAPYSATSEALAERDVIVIAAANWLNSYDDFTWLAYHLEKNQKPVVIVGLGAQSGLDKAIPRLKDGTLRAMKLISERSVAISTRGAFSAEVLNAYGIKNVIVTGCPSLLMAGRRLPAIRSSPELAWARSVVHATRSGYSESDAFQTYLYRQAIKHDAEVVLQSETPEIDLLVGCSPDEDTARKSVAILKDVYGESADIVQDYIRRRARVFFTTADWINVLAKKDFCFGTRFHGTIAALLAGCNATLITHDSRTMEMAQVMRVPFVDARIIDTETDLDIAQLYAPHQTMMFQAGYEQYMRNFLGFFSVNGLGYDTAHFEEVAAASR